MAFLTWVYDSGLATWLRETETIWGIDFMLCLHALGMAALVGLNSAIDLRILGIGSRMPLAPMDKFFRLMYAGFWVNLASGLLLLVAYPTKAFVNPGFYIKMGGVAFGVTCLLRIRREVFGNLATLDTSPVPINGKILAGISLLLWVVTITAGRLMAYSDVTGVQSGTTLAMLFIGVVSLLGWGIWTRLLGSSPDKPLRQGV